jgi:pantothenate kinase, type III
MPPMLLAADVGNTEIVLGVFRGPELVHTWRISTQAERTADELALLFSGFLAQADMSFESQVTGLVVASVVPDVTAAMREMASRYFPAPPVIVGPGTKTGVPILTDNPREVGADRVVNALAAFARFGGPAIVVDFGTATNFDVISDKGEFIGRAAIDGRSEATAARRVTCLTIDDPAAVVIGKEPVFVDGAPAGYVTSAAFGYSVGSSIAYAWLTSAAAVPGRRVEIDYFGVRVAARVAVEPLFDAEMSRLRR